METIRKERYDAMTYRRCGQSGLRLPLVSLGMWHNFGDTARYDTLRDICLTAFNHGVTHFDLANNYGPEPGSAEANLGKVLKNELAGYRDELIISTKAGYDMWPGPYGDGGSRKYLLASLDQSLRRMGLEYVDIFYHHRMDPQTPLEETMGALAQAVRQGKALYVGLSNYDGPTLERAAAILDELHCPFIINQNRYSMLDRTVERNGLKETSRRLGKGIIAFSPLEQGMLSDRYLNGIPADSRVRTDGRFLHASDLTEQKLGQIRALNELAQQRGQTLAQMALAWVLRDSVVTSVVVGASRPEQLVQNLQGLDKLEFSAEELEAIDRITLRPEA
ncbi:L-glyceraldehyde 3-phosphate reductase [uncultured Allofournierella sp.]|uniref:L-glyceraldehyde 3-phosphate reductase n=1 Tax=uncultured Allofournierella sp. TaxID=1940258 RepID=UPI0025E99DB1|nr:L-glyceraldehyde 3-phosphate reductase [uncultured Fournierella sp.]